MHDATATAERDAGPAVRLAAGHQSKNVLFRTWERHNVWDSTREIAVDVLEDVDHVSAATMQQPLKLVIAAAPPD